MADTTRKKDRKQFIDKVAQLLLSFGAIQDGSEHYPFTLTTNAGPLRLHLDVEQSDGLGTVFTRFDDPQTAKKLVDCNQYSGKWNHHYFDGWTVETALADLSFQLKKVVS